MLSQYGKYGLQRQGQSPDGDTNQDQAQGVPLQNGQETEAPGQDMQARQNQFQAAQGQNQMNQQAQQMQRPQPMQQPQQPIQQAQPMQQAAPPQQPQAMPRSRFSFQQPTRQAPGRFMDRQGPRFGASWQ